MGVFWIGSLLTLVTVILIIATDRITWDRLNRGFVASTGTKSLFIPPQYFEATIGLYLKRSKYDY